MNTVLMFVIMGLVCRFKAPGGGFKAVFKGVLKLREAAPGIADPS